MPEFHRTAINDETFIRGAARLLVANITVTFPTKIGDVVNMSTYEPMSGWSDLGATKEGISISVNASEESFDVDQINGDIRVLPTNWECAVQTALAQMNLENLQVAWEGSPVTTDTAPITGSEKEMGFGQPLFYTERRVAVVFKRISTTSEKMRAYFFRRMLRAAAESNVVYAKTGPQQMVQLRLRALADTSVADIYKRYFIIRDQV